MWGDLKGLRKLLSKLDIPLCKWCLEGGLVIKIKEDTMFDPKPTHICFLLPHPAS